MEITPFAVVGLLIAASHLAVVILLLVWFSLGKPTSWVEFKRRYWRAVHPKTAAAQDALRVRSGADRDLR